MWHALFVILIVGWIVAALNRLNREPEKKDALSFCGPVRGWADDLPFEEWPPRRTPEQEEKLRIDALYLEYFENARQEERLLSDPRPLPPQGLSKLFSAR